MTHVITQDKTPGIILALITLQEVENDVNCVAIGHTLRKLQHFVKGKCIY